MPSLQVHPRFLNLTSLLLHSHYDQTLALRSQSEDAWRRENALVREQLAVATRREIALERQVRDCETQLETSEQEIEQLRQSLVASRSSSCDAPAPSSTGAEAASSATRVVVSARERELLKFITDIIGKDTIRSLLSANPYASPAELRQKLRHFHQQERLDERQRSSTAAPSLFTA